MFERRYFRMAKDGSRKRFEILATWWEVRFSRIAWDNMASYVVTPYSLETARRFGRTYHLYLQDRRVCQGRKKQGKGEMLMRLKLSSSFGFLLSLPFLKMEGDCSSETSVNIQPIIRRYNPQD
jgi:hypothetical protein